MNTATIYQNALIKLSQSASKKTAALAQEALDAGAKADKARRKATEDQEELDNADWVMRQMGGD